MQAACVAAAGSGMAASPLLTPRLSLPQAGPVVLGAFFEQEMYASLGYWVALLQVVGLTATLVAYKASHRRLPAPARET